MLILFDIDGTLYRGNGSGKAAFLRAGRKIFGEPFHDEGVAYAGRLDPHIMVDLIAANGHTYREAEHLAPFRALTTTFLRENQAKDEFGVRTFPGVFELIKRLQQHEDQITLGLLTGNWPENASIKLETIGIDPAWFPIGAFATDGPTRNDLPPVGRARYREMTGRDIPFERIVIVGDTLNDVGCAKAHDCACIAVATGGGTLQELAASDADLVVQDLSETDMICQWILDLAAGEPDQLAAENVS